MFRTPDRFGEMARDGCPMAHRLRSYPFEALRDASGAMLRNVLIEGPDGHFHIAEYAMVMTENGWKISGVRIFLTARIGV